MSLTIRLVVGPEEADDDDLLKSLIIREIKEEVPPQFRFKIIKRSIDARNKHIKVNLTIEVYFSNSDIPAPFERRKTTSVSKKKEVIIVGTGPAGLFAALELIKFGIRPILLERGKDVRERRRDLAAINKQHLVNPNSNYCFGEGGAGTYSDGKLYTRSNKRGNINDVLNTFIEFGADENILVEAHPHIGTNKLPQIITNIRNYILECGGTIYFNHMVNDIVIESDSIKGVTAINLENKQNVHLTASSIILATGHSARDIFELLNRKNITIEAKPFALGVRIEHPQDTIDAMQYHCKLNEVEQVRKHLPPAAYNWVEQVDGKGVFSFCMCPGGIIAPCATSQEEIVTNGWSPSKRNNPFANSGIVVSIDNNDLTGYAQHGALAGVEFQKDIEHKAWLLGGKTQAAPAQRAIDFINGVLSKDLPKSSYQPGLRSVELTAILPEFISGRLKEGLKLFGKKKREYLSNEAVLVAVESRTSSPVRIPRNNETLSHPNVKHLYPCGEGAGYAGGIVSAAIDGIKVATAISQNLK